MSPTLILHIGSEKTGSKSIQHSMWRSSAHLYKSYGVLYPRKLPLFLRNAHYPIVSPFIPAAELDFVASDRRLTVQQLHEALRALRDRSGASKIVLSAEHLSSRLKPPGIAGLRKSIAAALPDHRIVILYNVRSQATQYCAAISTHIKTFGVNPTPVADISSSTSRFLNHFQVASEWADVFGTENMIIRNYHSYDALSILYTFLGVDLNDKKLHRPTKRNTSLSQEQALILQAVNAAFGKPDFDDEVLIRLRRHVQGSLIYYLSYVLKASTPLVSILTPQDMAHFRQEFSELNGQLTDRFALDFNLNDYMDIETPAASPQPSAADRAAYLFELRYWQKKIGQGPFSPKDAVRVAKRLRALLVGKHIRRLFSERGRVLDMSRELVGRI